MIDTDTIKKDFPLFNNEEENGLFYLDSSSSSQTPVHVLDSMDAYYRTYRANTRRGQYPMSEKAESSYEGARILVAQFLNASAREIIFTAGATASANLIVYSLENSDIFKEGDEIVTTIMEHHSLFVPLQKLAKRKKLIIKIIPMKEQETFGELDYVIAKELITPKTKLVAFVGVSNVTGTINEMKELCIMAREVGAYSLIDATQGAGHMPLDVKDIGCDFMFFAGHKMCGPVGIGVLYGKQELLEKLEPGFYGGGMIEEVTLEGVKFAPVPHKFEAGTPNIAGAIGLGAACVYLQKIGLENIQKHSEEINAYALSRLSAISEIKLYCHQSPEKNIGVMSFTVSGVHPHDVGEIFSRAHVATRGGHHCAQPLMKAMGVSSVNRASFYLYTTKEDIDALVNGLLEVRRVFA